MASHGSTDDSPCLEVQDDEDVERLKPHGLHGEEVDANDAFGLVAQKGPPGLRILLQGCGSNPLQISRDSTYARSLGIPRGAALHGSWARPTLDSRSPSDG